MRALYQRRKGRDLFDMWFAITQKKIAPSKIIEAWIFYMKKEGNSVTQKEFLENMERKIIDQDFLNDMEGLLRPGLTYSISNAFKLIKEEILEKIQP